MHNLSKISGWVGLLMWLGACQQEYVQPTLTPATTAQANAWKKPSASCPEYFYLYEQTPVNLGTVSTRKIVLGFQDNITTSQKVAFIQQYAYLESIENELNTGSADATVVILKENLTCAEVEEILSQLINRSELRYANPFFQSPFDTNLLGITNQFIVNLHPTYDYNDLEKLTKRTKTQIVEQLGDQTFIMSADKYATGNALEMANEFAGFYQVQSSEPDFLYVY